MKILIIDGQGGGIGCRLITELKAQGLIDIQMIAVGTNSLATSAMLKAGADAAATGENPVIYNCQKANLILGSMGILSANSMLGEITPAMANAVACADAVKILIPFSKCSVLVAGVAPNTMDGYIKQAVELAKKVIQNEE